MENNMKYNYPYDFFLLFTIVECNQYLGVWFCQFSTVRKYIIPLQNQYLSCPFWNRRQGWMGLFEKRLGGIGWDSIITEK